MWTIMYVVSGGPIALVENDDLIEISLKGRAINVVGVNGQTKSAEQMKAIIDKRIARWQPRIPRYASGALGIYCETAASAMEGAYMRCQPEPLSSG